VKWSRLAYCAALTAITTLLIARGTSPWITIPLGMFSAWWTFTCTRALWHVTSYRLAVWRLRQAPSLSMSDLAGAGPRRVKSWQWLSDPRLDGLVNVVTIVGALVFPALLWLPLIYWIVER
jgi:hypothetical protein